MRFEKLESGDFLDSETNLVWSLMSRNACTYEQANEYAELISLRTGLPWRLPTCKELASLIDYELFDPATMLPGERTDWTWTSTSYKAVHEKMWAVNLDTGSVYVWDIDDHLAIRLVRNI